MSIYTLTDIKCSSYNNEIAEMMLVVRQLWEALLMGTDVVEIMKLMNTDVQLEDLISALHLLQEWMKYSTREQRVYPVDEDYNLLINTTEMLERYRGRI